jgi:hypothetical protein
MELTTVNSEMVHALGYDNETQELEVIFTSGGIYRYNNVPRSVFDEMMHSPSIGHYMHTHIMNAYPYHEVSRRKRGFRRKQPE